jgi:hypothetical protein
MASAKNDSALRGFSAPKNPFTLDANDRLVHGQGADGMRLIPSLQFWDHVKRSLDAVGSREAQQWSKILRDHLDPLFPEYAAARGGAAKFFGAEDALEAGKAAVQNTRMDNRQIRNGLGKLSAVERKLFQDGFVDEFVQSIRSLGDRTNIDKINSTPKARERLLMVVGPERTNEIEAYLRVEDQMQRANRKITGGSTTAEQKGDMKIGAMDLFDLKGAMFKMLRGAASAAGRGIDERVATKIAEMLTSSNEKEFGRAIKLIGKNKRLMSAIRNPDEAYTAAAARGAVSSGDADWQERRRRQRGIVTVD